MTDRNWKRFGQGKVRGLLAPFLLVTTIAAGQDPSPGLLGPSKPSPSKADPPAGVYWLHGNLGGRPGVGSLDLRSSPASLVLGGTRYFWIQRSKPRSDNKAGSSSWLLKGRLLAEQRGPLKTTLRESGVVDAIRVGGSLQDSGSEVRTPPENPSEVFTRAMARIQNGRLTLRIYRASGSFHVLKGLNALETNDEWNVTAARIADPASAALARAIEARDQELATLSPEELVQRSLGRLRDLQGQLAKLPAERPGGIQAYAASLAADERRTLTELHQAAGRVEARAARAHSKGRFFEAVEQLLPYLARTKLRDQHVPLSTYEEGNKLRKRATEEIKFAVDGLEQDVLDQNPPGSGEPLLWEFAGRLGGLWHPERAEEDKIGRRVLSLQERLHQKIENSLTSPARLSDVFPLLYRIRDMGVALDQHALNQSSLCHLLRKNASALRESLAKRVIGEAWDLAHHPESRVKDQLPLALHLRFIVQTAADDAGDWIGPFRLGQPPEREFASSETQVNLDGEVRLVSGETLPLPAGSVIRFTSLNSGHPEFVLVYDDSLSIVGEGWVAPADLNGLFGGVLFPQRGERMVYISSSKLTGKRYHTDDCHFGKVEIPYKQAKRAGLTPCQVCRPDD